MFILEKNLSCFPGAGGNQMSHGQPQVKIITPQGRMQMQQIQTPSGPKLIAVPVGGGSIQVNFQQK